MQIWASAPTLRLVSFSPHHRTRHLRFHRHPFYELGIVMGGFCDWRVGRRQRFALRPGQAILLKPEALHCEEIQVADEARLAWLGFDFEGKPPAWCHRPITLDADTAEINGYFETISREHHRSDPRSQTRINLAMQSLLLLIERCADGQPDSPSVRSSLNSRQTRTVESAAHYFRHNLQRPLSIAQVAAYHSLCPAHFSSLFRRHHAVTPRGFLRQARLQRAADLLAESDLTLKEIAAQCGFVDAAHLCKSFKQEHRIAPGLYRNRSRESQPIAVVQ